MITKRKKKQKSIGSRKLQKDFGPVSTLPERAAKKQRL